MTRVDDFDSGLAPDPRAHKGDVLLAISNAIVRIYKECFGKGPTKAKTYYQGDVVTCLLQGGLTRADLTLIESGYEEAVLNQRSMLQQAARDRFVAAVEELLGRPVIGFMSGTQSDPDMSVEVFVLAAEDDDSA